MILKHVGWSVVVFGSIPKSNLWSVDCTQVSDSGPLGLLFLKEIVASPTYCKCGYFRLGKISRKYWQYATPFSLIKSLLSFYFRKGGLSVKKAISRKLPPREISAFTVHTCMYAYIDLATPIMNSLKLPKKNHIPEPFFLIISLLLFGPH